MPAIQGRPIPLEGVGGNATALGTVKLTVTFNSIVNGQQLTLRHAYTFHVVPRLTDNLTALFGWGTVCKQDNPIGKLFVLSLLGAAEVTWPFQQYGVYDPHPVMYTRPHATTFDESGVRTMHTAANGHTNEYTDHSQWMPEPIPVLSASSIWVAASTLDTVTQACAPTAGIDVAVAAHMLGATAPCEACGGAPCMQASDDEPAAAVWHVDPLVD